MQLFRVLLVAALSLFSASNAQCTQPRIRKSWTALTSSEKTLYRDAIAMAMGSGTYNRFLEIHTEMMSEQEAHGQCMFVYWHRLFLVAFENMLRGQNARFACVTLPYWDWVTEYNNFQTGRCNNVLSCSPFLQENGGSPTNYSYRSVTINGQSIRGYCVNSYPLDLFCESRNVRGTQCAKCMPRGNWGALRLPGSASYGSVRSQVLFSANIAEMSKAIEQGAHNAIHGTMDSTMATFQSPADPVFWSHHATIDAIHSIFHKCKVGEQITSLQAKASNPVSWTNCARRDGTPYRPFDSMTLRTGYMGQSPMNAAQDPLIGRYFTSVSMQFVAQVNTRDMGTSSYTYQLQGQLGTLYSTCGAARRLNKQPHDSATPPPPPPMSALVQPIVDPANQQVSAFVATCDASVKETGGQPIVEVEKMTCMFQDVCLGGVKDYSPAFKKQFNLTEPPRCKQIVDQIKSCQGTIKLSDWKQRMVNELGCPIPK